MSTLTIPVAMPGAQQAAAQMSALDQAATKGAGSMDRASVATARAGTVATGTGKAWEQLSAKMRAGEFLRNSTASFALLSTAGQGAADKITALAASLAAIPGPVGAVAAAVTVGATAWNLFAKSAEAAAKAAADAAAEVKGLEGQRDQAMANLAARIGAAAGQVGPGLREAMAQGFDPEQRKRLAALTPGDVKASLSNAVALSGSGLDSGGQGQVEAILKEAQSAGYEITKELVGQAIATVKERTAAFAPNADQATVEAARAAYAERGGGIFGPTAPMVRASTEANSSAMAAAEAVAGPNATAEAIQAAQRRILGSRSGAARGVDAVIRRAEAMAVQQGENTMGAALGAGGTIGGEAIKQVLDRNVDGMASLEGAIRDLDKSITAAKDRAATARAEAYTGHNAIFNSTQAPSPP